MTPQELNQRKQRVLGSIIRDFLNTAVPVGSRTIWRNYIHDLSPATIRNEMADLEEDGYIAQPYTSAGRIPTDQGYRFYINHLMRSPHLTAREHEIIRKEIRKSFREIEDTLHHTAQILSHTLDYAAIVVNLEQHHRVFSAGYSNLLRQPEFQNIINMQHVLDILEKEEFLTEMVEEYSEPEQITIRIGSENKYKEMKECSVVVTTYETKTGRGGLGVIGPTRMHYNRVMSIVDCIAKELQAALGAQE